MSVEFETSKRIQKYLIEIIKKAQMCDETNKVKIDTNLECNVPEKDIHKIAGPFIDEWVYETFSNEQKKSTSTIKSVISRESSSLEDVFVSLELDGEQYDVLIDVKSAALAKGTNAGKGSNLTSFRKIRPFYIKNPEALFFILSIEHRNLMIDDKCHGFELVDCNIFDLKYVISNELMLNISMGDQFQISNSMRVTQIDRTTEEFIDLIDKMFLSKYSVEKLNKIIADEQKLEEIQEIAYVVYDIIQENEPIKMAAILSYLKRIVPNNEEIEKLLGKALAILKKNSKILTQNRYDYIIYHDNEE